MRTRTNRVAWEQRMKLFGGVALGASVGLLLGFVGGAVASYLNRSDPSDQGYAFILTTPFGILLGAIVGGIWAWSRR
jgi:NhaP-type Na+/H+ or K+/H+ antiporter